MHKNLARPLQGDFKKIVLFITGNSGNGKSTFAEHLNHPESGYISMDQLILDEKHGIVEIIKIYNGKIENEQRFSYKMVLPLIFKEKKLFIAYIIKCIEELNKSIIYVDCFGIPKDISELLNEFILQNNNKYFIWKTNKL